MGRVLDEADESVRTSMKGLYREFQSLAHLVYLPWKVTY